MALKEFCFSLVALTAPRLYLKYSRKDGHSLLSTTNHYVLEKLSGGGLHCLGIFYSLGKTKKKKKRNTCIQVTAKYRWSAFV